MFTYFKTRYGEVLIWWNILAAFSTLELTCLTPTRGTQPSRTVHWQNRPWRPNRFLAPIGWSAWLHDPPCFLWTSKILSQKCKLSLCNGTLILGDKCQIWRISAAIPSCFPLGFWFVFCLRNCFAYSKPWRYYPMFSPKSFLTFVSIIQLQLIFEYGIKQVSSFTLPYAYSMDQVLLTGKSPAALFVINQVLIWNGSFLGPQFCSFAICLFLWQYHPVLITWELYNKFW